jgi:RNA polymerase sigma-70 factor, ECF subfamily
MSGVIVADATMDFQFDSGGSIRSGESAPSQANVCDRALIAALCAGDEAAYEVLISRFEHPVYNLIARLTVDPADADDITQEVFLKVFRNVGTFRGDSSLKTWIYRIAVNEARNHHRWFGRHKKQEVGLEPESGESHGCIDYLTDPGRSPLDLAMDQETQAFIETALSEINPHFRAALVLREIEGLSYEEIAEILEISLGTVKSRILRGREALREKLSVALEGSTHREWRAKEVLAR